jgi:hypothetical protein
MLIIKVYGIPTSMHSDTAFEEVVASWVRTITTGVADFTPLAVKQTNVHVFFLLTAYVKASPEKIVIEISGSSLMVATRTVSLTEVERHVAKVASCMCEGASIHVSASMSM